MSVSIQKHTASQKPAKDGKMVYLISIYLIYRSLEVLCDKCLIVDSSFLQYTMEF